MARIEAKRQTSENEETQVAIELNSFIKEKDSDRILVRHSFYGRDEAEAEKFKRHHLASCEYFRAAEADHRTIDISIDIDELPEFDEAELERFLDIDDEPEDYEDEEDEEDEEEEEAEEVEE